MNSITDAIDKIEPQVDPAPNEIPVGVFWNGEKFLAAEGPMSAEFHAKWIHLSGSFPAWEDDEPAEQPGTEMATQHHSELMAKGIEENRLVEQTISNDRDRQYKLLQEIHAAISDIQSVILKAQTDRAALDSKLERDLERIRAKHREAADKLTSLEGESHKKHAELQQQKEEAVRRIDLMGQMLHVSEMDELRRSVQ